MQNSSELEGSMDALEAKAERNPQSEDTPLPTGAFAAIDRFYLGLGRVAFPCLVLLLAGLVTLVVLASSHKPFWYDEVFTVIVATRSTWHDYHQALPAEGNPPLNTLLTGLSIRLFGLSELTVRLPELLAFVAALGGVYVFVRREVGSVLALLAVVLTFVEPAWRYSHEARPYGLLLAFLVLGLVSWQSATSAADSNSHRTRTLALCGMAVAIIGSTLSHDIGILEIGIPLLCGEAVRSARNRRIDWPVAATGLAALPALAIVLPMMRRTGQVVISHSRIISPPITVEKLSSYAKWALSSWALVMSTRLLALLAVVVLAAHLLARTEFLKRRFGSPWPTCAIPKVPDHIYAAAIGATLLIPLTWLAMIPAHGWYFCRYGIGSIVGVAILTALLLRGVERQNRLTILLLFCVLLAGFGQSAHRKLYPLMNLASNEAILFQDSSDLPIVVADPLNYPVLWWYAPAAVKPRLIYLVSAQVSQGDPATELLDSALVGERPAFGSQMLDYKAFLNHQNHFLLAEDGLRGTLKTKLLQDGCAATPLRASNAEKLSDVRC